MASQRHQLLQVQQQAAAEIVQLMQRLNEVRAPLQERLAAYEQQIQELERELGQQSKENRELLRLQIDLLKEQVKAERAASRMDFN
jgi:predicted nucleic acid-binding protein